MTSHMTPFWGYERDTILSTTLWTSHMTSFNEGIKETMTSYAQRHDCTAEKWTHDDVRWRDSMTRLTSWWRAVDTACYLQELLYDWRHLLSVRPAGVLYEVWFMDFQRGSGEWESTGLFISPMWCRQYPDNRLPLPYFPPSPALPLSSLFASFHFIHAEFASTCGRPWGEVSSKVSKLIS